MKGDAAAGLREIALHWMEEIWRPGDLSSFDELHAPDFVDHSPAGRGSSRDDYHAGIEDLFAAFPDFTAQTDDLLLDPAAGKAAIRWSAVGTQQKAFLGCPPTGRRIQFTGIEIITVRSGQISERWGEWDGLSILEQLSE